MGLNIKNEETYRVVRELAQVTGRSMTAVVHDAAARMLAQVSTDGHDARAARVAQIVAAYQAACPDRDLHRRAADLYDEDGLFR